ncbi:MAG: hypothetical protein BGO31_01290 [Bacteroidetes bacterium 43-16]|nr:MAG: hypothetical protein BGO31_01290 [Bacteroidetes bacterium 43-16]
MKKVVYPALLLAGALALTSSCNKKNNTPAKVCKIQRVTSGTESYLFSYDDQFRISKMESQNRIANFSYNGNQQTILTTSSGSFSNKRIITTNDAGLTLNVRSESNTAGTVWTNEAYNYNGNQVSTIVATNSTGLSTSTTNYIWSSDGNLSSIVNPSGTITELSYYTDKEYREGDYLNVLNLVQNGHNFIRNKNLVKTLSASNTISYEFDTENKVNSINVNSSSVQLEYTCR